jgi:hypothetical protein
MVDLADYPCHGSLLLPYFWNPDAYSLIQPERPFYLYYDLFLFQLNNTYQRYTPVHICLQDDIPPEKGTGSRTGARRQEPEARIKRACIAKGLYSLGAHCNVPLHISYQPVEIISSKQIGYLKYRIDKDPADNI